MHLRGPLSSVRAACWWRASPLARGGAGQRGPCAQAAICIARDGGIPPRVGLCRRNARPTLITGPQSRSPCAASAQCAQPRKPTTTLSRAQFSHLIIYFFSASSSPSPPFVFAAKKFSTVGAGIRATCCRRPLLCVPLQRGQRRQVCRKLALQRLAKSRVSRWAARR